MTRCARTLALSLSTLLALAPAAALAQARTGTGGGPESAAKAPNTTSVGQTKPPSGGAGAGPEAGRRTQQERVDDKISSGICIGCSPK